MDEDFKKNISNFNNEKLCEIIVANRYLGSMREEAILCMEELAKRRTNGDEFNFEIRIDELFKSLPKLNLDLNKIFKMPKLSK